MSDYMKAFITLILGLTLALGVNAAIPQKDTAPFIPEVYKALRDLEDKNTGQDSRLITLEAVPRTIRAVYDVALHGGGIGPHSLGVALPAKAIIKRSWYQIGTQFVDAGSGTVAISCEDANNILTATDITGQAALSLHDGQSTGSLASMVQGIAANCEVTATVAGAAQSAGRLVMFVEYELGL